MVCAGGGSVLLVAAEATRSRRLGVAGSLLALAGSMCGRWMVYKAGFASAADPLYTVEPQKERRGARGRLTPSR
jgi:hypothetical protein